MDHTATGCRENIESKFPVVRDFINLCGKMWFCFYVMVFVVIFVNLFYVRTFVCTPWLRKETRPFATTKIFRVEAPLPTSVPASDSFAAQRSTREVTGLQLSWAYLTW